MKEIHYTYAIVNKLNGKTYIGVHSTKDIDDGYLGSGTNIRRAIKKYGKKNFSKMVINYYITREAALKEEKYIVDEEFLRFDWSYNITTGGFGFPSGEAHPYFGGGKMTEEHKRKIGLGAKGRIYTKEQREQCSKLNSGEENGFYNKSHSEESKNKISKTKTGVKQSTEVINKRLKARRNTNSKQRKPVQHIPSKLFFESLMEACDVMGLEYKVQHQRLYRSSKKNEFKNI